MIDPATGDRTYHTTNPVPLFTRVKKVSLRQNGALQDIRLRFWELWGSTAEGNDGKIQKEAMGDESRSTSTAGLLLTDI